MYSMVITATNQVSSPACVTPLLDRIGVSFVACSEGMMIPLMTSSTRSTLHSQPSAALESSTRSLKKATAKAMFLVNSAKRGFSYNSKRATWSGL